MVDVLLQAQEIWAGSEEMRGQPCDVLSVLQLPQCDWDLVCHSCCHLQIHLAGQGDQARADPHKVCKSGLMQAPLVTGDTHASKWGHVDSHVQFGR